MQKEGEKNGKAEKLKRFMNKKTDNMDMDNAYMRAEQKRQETERHATRLKEFLIYGADIPEDIQKQYGFSEDYRLYKELEEMDGRQYSEKRQKGEVPDAGKVGGRLTRAVEKAYESICGSPSRVYIEGLYKELLLLGGMTVRKDYDDPVHYNPGFFDKYGIDRKAPRETILRQVEQAYRELDSRFSRMTGRRSDADELFGKPKEKQAVQPRKENPDRPAPGIRPCRPKGRRMGF